LSIVFVPAPARTMSLSESLASIAARVIWVLRTITTSAPAMWSGRLSPVSSGCRSQSWPRSLSASR